MGTIGGATNNSGTYVLELNGGFDHTLGGMVPTAVAGTLIRGAWKRTGDVTFQFSSLAMIRDAQGNTLYIVKMYGTDTLLENCNTVMINVVLDLLQPDFSPWFSLGPQDVHYGHRILAEP